MFKKLSLMKLIHKSLLYLTLAIGVSYIDLEGNLNCYYYLTRAVVRAR